MAESFVHLHNHTEYSMLDGAARIEELVLAAKADGQRALGITDHGNLYGVIDFYEACRKHDVTPIIGLEAYMAANSRFDRPARRGKIDDTGGDTEGGQKLYHHLTLLATSNEGYRNLRELSSALSPDLGAELSRMSPPFSPEVPTESELRIAQAQLVGWLEGLFHGIQASLFAQQAAATAQLEKMRDRSLNPGSPEPRAGTYL